MSERIAGRTEEPVSRRHTSYSQNPFAEVRPAKRAVHGGTAWTMGDGLRQPQDGADVAQSERVTDIRSSRLHLASRMDAVTSVEPEDARITGGTRSLLRRLLGLNITPTRPALNRKPMRASMPQPAMVFTMKQAKVA